MKRLLGYRKKIVSLMCAVMIVSIGILSTSFQSNAGVDVQRMFHHPEPPVADGSGWVAFLIYNASSGYEVKVYSISTLATDDNVGDLGSLGSLFIYKNYFEVAPFALMTNNAKGFYSLMKLDEGGSVLPVKYSSTERAKVTFDGYSIVDFRVYGDIMVYVDSVPGTTVSWNVIFDGGDAINHYARLIYQLINSLSTNSQSGLDDISSAIESLYDYIEFFQDDVNWDFDRLADLLNDIDSYLAEVCNVLKDELGDVNDKLDTITEQLNDCEDLLSDMLEEQRKSNTWLGKIWDSIQEFVNPKDEDSSKTDEFQDSSNAQKSEINDLNEQNQVDKVDVDSAAAQVDSNIDYDNMAQYGGVLATVTNNSYVLQMILIVVSIGIIAYVLFGKR